MKDVQEEFKTFIEERKWWNQTIELSDDEDEAKTVGVESKDVANDEERVVEHEETKSEIRTRSGRMSKIPNWLQDYGTF